MKELCNISKFVKYKYKYSIEIDDIIIPTILNKILIGIFLLSIPTNFVSLSPILTKKPSRVIVGAPILAILKIKLLCLIL